MGSIVGAAISGAGANKAAKTLGKGAADANAVAKQQYDIATGNLTPYLNTGTLANGQLQNLLGLGSGTKNAWDPALESSYQGWLGTNNTTGGNTDNSINRAQFAAGNGITDTFTKGADFGSLAKSFSMDDYQADPGYQFRLDEGQKALERSQAAKGGLLSGAAAKALTSYNSGMASQEYGAAYDRYNTNQNNVYNRLSGLSASGQNAAGTLGNLGSNYANVVGGNLASAASANAAAQVQNANSMGQSFAGTIGNAVQGGINGFNGNITGLGSNIKWY